jgi:MFS family permease
LTVGGIALILFIFVELAQKQPLLELKVFKSSDFTRCIILTWIVQLALFGVMLIVPLYLQGVMHYTAFETGWILLPFALCAAIGMPISGRLFDKIGARPLAFAGLAVANHFPRRKRGSGRKHAERRRRGLRRHVLPVRVYRDRGCRTVAPSA